MQMKNTYLKKTQRNKEKETIAVTLIIHLLVQQMTQDQPPEIATQQHTKCSPHKNVLETKTCGGRVIKPE